MVHVYRVPHVRGTKSYSRGNSARRDWYPVRGEASRPAGRATSFRLTYQAWSRLDPTRDERSKTYGCPKRHGSIGKYYPRANSDGKAKREKGEWAWPSWCNHSGGERRKSGDDPSRDVVEVDWGGNDNVGAVDAVDDADADVDSDSDKEVDGDYGVH